MLSNYDICRISGSNSGGYEEYSRLTFKGLHDVISQKIVLFNYDTYSHDLHTPAFT
jgi:hypothetical protein